jgi:hypothetical protein
VRRAQLNNITLHSFPLPNKRGPLHHRYIIEVLQPLSREALCFLNKFDLAAIEELLVFTNEPGSPPQGCYTGPLSWLLSNGLGPGGRKIYDKILALDLENDLQGIMDPIPLIREQRYQVSPDSFFRVAGILPDGNVSGRFFKSDPDTKGKAVTRLVVDKVVLSNGRGEMRGSGFTTSLPVSHFLTAPGCGGGSRRVITSEGSYFWRVHAILPFRPVDPPRDLPDSPLIPNLPDKLKDIVSYLEENNVVPTHMSSDAGLDHFTGPPSSVFRVGPQLANRFSACVIVVYATFFPLKRHPAVAIVIEGLERIPHLNSFIEVRNAEWPCLSSGVATTSPFWQTWTVSVTDMQASQAHLPPAEAQAQGKVYN